MLDAVKTKVEESDDEMENLEPRAKRGRGRGSRGKSFSALLFLCIFIEFP